MLSPSTSIRFVLDGAIVELPPLDPLTPVLDILRYRLRRTGTKEGCAEGDCGACTVLLGELDRAGEVRWRAVNACILLAPMLNGRALMTVESLGRDGALSPVQAAMVEKHGSQCGFCTPGIVMSLHGASLGAAGTVGVPAVDVLAGNLCRCTGYGPILQVAAELQPAEDGQAGVAETLRELGAHRPLALEWTDPQSGEVRRWLSPRTKVELGGALKRHPDARLVAGATDVGLWITKQLRVLPTVIWLGDILELARIEEGEAALNLGAGARYVDAAPALARLHPEFGELIRRIGAVQVRNAGTIGGNIANGSPIGDMPPALIALGAELVLRKGAQRRVLPLEDFFVAYGRQDRRPGEYVEEVRIPRPAPGALVRIVKLSKRFDSDISAVCFAAALRIDAGRVADARIAFGGMGPTPARARACEAALMGRAWSAEAVEAAAQALGRDFTPMTDQRGSAAYRTAVAANLVQRLWPASAPEPTLMALEPVDV